VFQKLSTRLLGITDKPAASGGFAGGLAQDVDRRTTSTCGKVSPRWGRRQVDKVARTCQVWKVRLRELERGGDGKAFKLHSNTNGVVIGKLTIAKRDVGGTSSQREGGYFWGKFGCGGSVGGGYSTKNHFVLLTQTVSEYGMGWDKGR